MAGHELPRGRAERGGGLPRGDLDAQDDELAAAADYERYLLGESTDNMLELSEFERKRVHNLKYYTWVEQQGKTYEEIQAQWYQTDYWTEVQKLAPEIDVLIEEFNAEVGLLK